MSDPELYTEQDCAEDCKRMLQTSIQRREELDRAYAAIRDLALVVQAAAEASGRSCNQKEYFRKLIQHAAVIEKARERK